MSDAGAPPPAADGVDDVEAVPSPAPPAPGNDLAEAPTPVPRPADGGDGGGGDVVVEVFEDDPPFPDVQPAPPAPPAPGADADDREEEATPPVSPASADVDVEEAVPRPAPPAPGREDLGEEEAPPSPPRPADDDDDDDVDVEAAHAARECAEFYSTYGSSAPESEAGEERADVPGDGGGDDDGAASARPTRSRAPRASARSRGRPSRSDDRSRLLEASHWVARAEEAEVAAKRGGFRREGRYRHPPLEPLLPLMRSRRRRGTAACVCVALVILVLVLALGPPSSDDAAGAALETQIADFEEELAHEADASVLRQYVPRDFGRSAGWSGTTHAEAVEFCAGVRSDYGLCPYDAICPRGPGAAPRGPGPHWDGPRWDDADVQWVPVAAEDDGDGDGAGGEAWAQVGRRGDVCARSTAGDAEGEGRHVARHVSCCLGLPGVDAAAEGEEAAAGEARGEAARIDPHAYEEDRAEGPAPATVVASDAPPPPSAAVVAPRYHVIQVTRAEGWEGGTYSDASLLCLTVPNYALCPYAALCPAGAGKAPRTGYDEGGRGDGGGRAWMPVVGGDDGGRPWAGVAVGNPCASIAPGGAVPTEWDSDGTAAEVLACCRRQTSDEQDAAAKEEASIYMQAAKLYRPRTYGREEGWLGRNHKAARKFCTIRKKIVCPYVAVCPRGPGSVPFGGYRDAARGARGAWLPVTQGDDRNAWAHVAETEEACDLYLNEQGKAPAWDGEEDATGHVACCQDPTEAPDEAEEGPAPEEVPEEGEGPAPGAREEAQEEEAGPTQDMPEEAPEGEGPAPTVQDEAHEEWVGQAYQAASNVFAPAVYDRQKGWRGTTYLEAVRFCAREAGYHICPYDAVCPLGPGHAPIVGYLGYRHGEAWAPVSDAADAWASLSSERACARDVDDDPARGRTGGGADRAEAATRHVLCCRGAPSAVAEKAPVYQDNFERHRPAWFDWEGRAWTDWEEGRRGRTHADAEAYCTTDKGLSLCPASAYCPFPDELLGGVAEGPERWAPTRGPNTWISVGTKRTCQVYGKPVEWGSTAAENNDISSRILCCKPTEEAGAASQAALPSRAPSPLPTSPPSKAPSPSPTIDQVYEAARDAFAPMAYSRGTGWTGSTYLDAVQFCAGKVGYHICPYYAICPAGPGGKPVTGYYENDSGAQWAPFSDKSYAWASLSSKSPCIKYPGNLELGLTVEESEASTHHVVCCKGSIFDSAEDDVLYQNSIERHESVWFNETEGWVGRTYRDAVDYCLEKDKSLCPFEAYCPLSDFGEPMGGVVDEPGGQWVPAANVWNMWISVGSEHTCQIYDMVFGEPPEWNITGAINDKMSSRILCCKLEEDEGRSGGRYVTPGQ